MRLPSVEEAHSLEIRWRGMLTRCRNSKRASYHRYGGRGITVCEEWHTFGNFIRWALISGFELHLTLDRIDNDGNYEPDNCRWATQQEQQLNAAPHLKCKKKIETLYASCSLSTCNLE